MAWLLVSAAAGALLVVAGWLLHRIELVEWLRMRRDQETGRWTPARWLACRAGSAAAAAPSAVQRRSSPSWSTRPTTPHGAA